MAVGKVLKSGKIISNPSRLSATADNTSASDPHLQWREVKAKYWWRNQHTQSLTKNQDMKLRKARFFKHMEGKCFRCLQTDHIVASCRNPFRCWSYRWIGHEAVNCPARRWGLKTPATLPLLLPNPSDFPPLPSQNSSPSLSNPPLAYVTPIWHSGHVSVSNTDTYRIRFDTFQVRIQQLLDFQINK